VDKAVLFPAKRLDLRFWSGQALRVLGQKVQGVDTMPDTASKGRQSTDSLVSDQIRGTLSGHRSTMCAIFQDRATH